MEGAKAIAAAVAASGSLTYLDLSQNKIGGKGAAAIAEAIRASGSLPLKTLRAFDFETSGLVAACNSKGVKLF